MCPGWKATWRAGETDRDGHVVHEAQAELRRTARRHRRGPRGSCACDHMPEPESPDHMPHTHPDTCHKSEPLMRNAQSHLEEVSLAFSNQTLAIFTHCWRAEGDGAEARWTSPGAGRLAPTLGAGGERGRRHQLRQPIGERYWLASCCNPAGAHGMG